MASIDEIMAGLNKKYKKNIIIKGTEQKKREFIPFSSPIANYMTRGGIAIGKMSEFSGAESSGKTTSAIDIMKNFQVMFPNKFITFLDAENTFDEEWATLLGVDMDKVIMIKPEHEHGEMLLDIVLDTIRSGDVGLVVIDSVPFIRTKQEFEGNLDDKTYAGNSQLLTTFCGKVIPLMNKFNTTLLGINQIRDKIGVHYTAYNMPGGRMWKHSMSQRIFFKKGTLLDEKYKEQTNSFETPTAHVIDMKYLKNKVTKPNRMSGSFTLNYELGVDVVYDTVELGIQLGVITPNGAWCRWKDLNIQGKANFTDRMREDEELFGVLKEEVNHAIMVAR